MKIKNIILLITLSTLISTPQTFTHATENDLATWQEEYYFEKNNPEAASKKYSQQADQILRYFHSIPNKTETDKQKYLNAAKYFYYKARRADLSNTDALVGQARIALYENRIRDAKNSLFIALNINEDNPKVNYYLGETFFKDGEFAKAVDFYLYAYTHGFRYNFWTNYKLGITYEKLDNVELARTHYTQAVKINPNFKDASKRLKGLDQIKTEKNTPKPIQQDPELENILTPKDYETLFGNENNDKKQTPAPQKNTQAPTYVDNYFPLDIENKNMSDLLLKPEDIEQLIDLDTLAPDIDSHSDLFIQQIDPK